MKLQIEKPFNVHGTVEISGSKNSAIAIIPAATLTDDEVILNNIPDIQDVRSLLSILNKQGFNTTFINNCLKIKRRKHIKKKFTTETSNLRASYYFIGAFLSKYHKIKFSECGGCNLGNRPIDYHLKAFEEMNISITKKKNYLLFNGKKKKSSTIKIPKLSVGTTINVMLSTVLTKGITTIYNASIEPEVIDVGNFLKAMGANITGLGSKTITVIGVNKLHGCTYTIIPDRIEAATYLAIGLVSTVKGVTVKNININHLYIPILYYKKLGAKVNIGENYITIFKPTSFESISLETGPYPFFPTDLNPIISACALLGTNPSIIKDNIYPHRISHINEFKKLNGKIIHQDNTTTIFPSKLTVNKLTAHDLRCAASLIIAGIITNESFEINNIEHLLRGYETPVEKLKNLNIKATIVE